MFVFGLTPQGGPDAQAYLDLATGIWHGGLFVFKERSSQYQTQIDGNWARGRHEVKFGLHHRRTISYDRFGWPGDGTQTTINAERLGLPTGVGYANITRRSAVATATGTVGVYVGDVMTFDRWTIDAGVRVDWQRGRNEPSSAPANGLAPAILPALEYSGGPYHTWIDLSPRLGVTFRATNSTIVRGSYARYANQMGSPIATVDNPAVMGTIRYTFQDLNRDHLAQAEELLGPTGFVMNVNPADPAAGYSPNQVDPNLRSPITDALVGGIEREVVPDLSLGLNFGHGVTSSTQWAPFIGLTSAHFEDTGPRSRQACRSRHRSIGWCPV